MILDFFERNIFFFQNCVVFHVRKHSQLKYIFLQALILYFCLFNIVCLSSYFFSSIMHAFLFFACFSSRFDSFMRAFQATSLYWKRRSLVFFHHRGEGVVSFPNSVIVILVSKLSIADSYMMHCTTEYMEYRKQVMKIQRQENTGIPLCYCDSKNAYIESG